MRLDFSQVREDNHLLVQTGLRSSTALRIFISAQRDLTALRSESVNWGFMFGRDRRPSLQRASYSAQSDLRE